MKFICQVCNFIFSSISITIDMLCTPSTQVIDSINLSHIAVPLFVHSFNLNCNQVHATPSSQVTDSINWQLINQSVLQLSNCWQVGNELEKNSMSLMAKFNFNFKCNLFWAYFEILLQNCTISARPKFSLGTFSSAFDWDGKIDVFFSYCVLIFRCLWDNRNVHQQVLACSWVIHNTFALPLHSEKNNRFWGHRSWISIGDIKFCHW